jgi:hypothetical protein
VDNWQTQVDDGEGGKKWVTEKRTLYGAKLSPVYSADPDSENKAFWDATPQGSFEVGSIHDGLFVPGNDYYIDITEAPAK